MQRVSNWVRGHAWTSTVIAFAFGIALGGSSNNGSDAATSQLSVVKGNLSSAESTVSSLESTITDLEAKNGNLVTELAEAESTLERLRARRPLPGLVGKSRSSILDLASRFGWHIEFEKQVSSEAVGSVIGQSPVAGTEMHAGARITVYVAKRAPQPQPEPEPEPESDQGCDPNYEGTCVPVVSYDLNCDDIGGTVYVVGSDPHGFDGDSDGVGCE